MTLHVHRYGEGPRLALAVHGITATSRAWGEVAAALPREWTLVAPDLRGRGHSRDLPASTGLHSHVDDLTGLAEQLVAEAGGPISLVGHSMGAFVAVHLAHARPDLFTRVVLVDGGVALPVPEGADPDEVLAATLGPALERLSRSYANADDYLEVFRHHPAFAGLWNPAIEGYVRYDTVEVDGRIRSRAQEESVRADGRDLLVSGSSFEPEVRATALPVRILAAPYGMFGEAPGLLPAAGLAAYDDADHVEVETVPGANHYTILFEPAAAARVAAAIQG
ncbi:alpha/beta fold hydrolase [Nocardioides flavescens]|uniref:Alpha/beta fold hydrolase n=1 Tax=Nocardioides flavescens TaxID=2691959 RepID=A0A6L7F1P7_9ACTN|nr:alpha/beta hydrolase [Nocardioides flavescens]MXG88964.1 alpha/beta fold hydrolase [Nocardioides flavescens]